MLCFSTHPTFKNCTVFWVEVLMHFLHLLESRFLISSALRLTYKWIVLLVCRAYGRQWSFFFRWVETGGTSFVHGSPANKHPSSKNHVYSFEKAMKRELIEPKLTILSIIAMKCGPKLRWDNFLVWVRQTLKKTSKKSNINQVIIKPDRTW